jgi:hypothetical protein
MTIRREFFARNPQRSKPPARSRQGGSPSAPQKPPKPGGQRPGSSPPKPARPAPLGETKGDELRFVRRLITSDPDGQCLWESPGRDELTATTQTKADIPPGAACKFGRLKLCYEPWSSRPLLVLELCGTQRPVYYPWRFDWPVTADTASLQPVVSPYRPHTQTGHVWLLLRPSAVAASQEVWRQGKTALDAWSQSRREAQAAKEAARRLADCSRGEVP